MTKRRSPLTVGDALAQVIAQLPGGTAQVAEICGRTTTTVYAWGNPDTDDDVPFMLAGRLDAAFQKHGGVGAPFHELLTVHIELAGASRFGNHIELGRLTADYIRENGEAEEALVLALLPDADRAHYQKTLEEIEQALAKGSARTLIRAHLDQPAGSHLGQLGQPHQTGPPLD